MMLHPSSWWPLPVPTAPSYLTTAPPGCRQTDSCSWSLPRTAPPAPSRPAQPRGVTRALTSDLQWGCRPRMGPGRWLCRRLAQMAWSCWEPSLGQSNEHTHHDKPACSRGPHSCDLTAHNLRSCSTHMQHWWHPCWPLQGSFCVYTQPMSCYNVTSSLTGYCWAQSQNDLCL